MESASTTEVNPAEIREQIAEQLGSNRLDREIRSKTESGPAKGQLQNWERQLILDAFKSLLRHLGYLIEHHPDDQTALEEMDVQLSGMKREVEKGMIQ